MYDKFLHSHYFPTSPLSNNLLHTFRFTCLIPLFDAWGVGINESTIFEHVIDRYSLRLCSLGGFPAVDTTFHCVVFMNIQAQCLVHTRILTNCSPVDELGAVAGCIQDSRLR